MFRAPVYAGFTIIVSALAISSGCAHKQPARAATPHTAPNASSKKNSQISVPQSAPAKIGETETGLASWYGNPYHGRRTASGEIYDMEQLTAAHRTLPFGTWVRVVNLGNGKTVDVRITDRGPFVENRIIDLSHAAAQTIELIGPGVATVRLDILSVPSTSGPNWYAVQAGAFLDRDRAERLRASLEREFGPAHLVQRADTASLWRVVVGRVPSEAAAFALAARVRSQTGTAFVVRLDMSPRTPEAVGTAH